MQINFQWSDAVCREDNYCKGRLLLAWLQKTRGSEATGNRPWMCFHPSRGKKKIRRLLVELPNYDPSAESRVQSTGCCNAAVELGICLSDDLMFVSVESEEQSFFTPASAQAKMAQQAYFQAWKPAGRIRKSPAICRGHSASARLS